MAKDTQQVSWTKHGPGRVLLTAAQLAERWQGAATVGTLANWRSKGVGPAFVKFGSRVRYPLDLVEKWEAENTHDPATMGGLPEAEASEVTDD